VTGTRAIHVTLGYIVACVASVLGTMLPFFPFSLFLLGGPSGPLLPVYLMAGVAVFALVPSAFAIAYAERHQIRSRRAYVGIGAGIGVVAVLLFGVSAYVYSRFEIESLIWAAYAPLGSLPGMIAGLAYHATAGREAGSDGRTEITP
jgi:hypothetical protein